MVDLDCPMCDGDLLVAFDDAALTCADCAIRVEIDPATPAIEIPLAAAA